MWEYQQKIQLCSLLSKLYFSLTQNKQKNSLGMQLRPECYWARTWPPLAAAQAWQHVGSWGQSDAPLLGSQEVVSNSQEYPGWLGSAQGLCYKGHCKDRAKFVIIKKTIFLCKPHYIGLKVTLKNYMTTMKVWMCWLFCVLNLQSP